MRPTPSRDPAPRGIVRASALPALGARPAPTVARAARQSPRPAQADTARAALRAMAPLRSRCMRVLAFDAAVLGALLSFVTELLALGARGLAALDGGRAMLLAALSLTACWVTVLGADLRRLLTLLRRWH